MMVEVMTSSFVVVVVETETMMSTYETVDVTVEKTTSAAGVTVSTVGDPNRDVQAAYCATGLLST
jgi:hypothetical protein